LLSLCSGGSTSDIYFKGHWERGFGTHLDEVERADSRQSKPIHISEFGGMMQAIWKTYMQEKWE
jgi:hypothetical protein